MNRHWRFVYDDSNGRRAGAWAWQVREGAGVRIASLCTFETLDRCIDHARESGFCFAQRYAIVFGRAREQAGS